MNDEQLDKLLKDTLPPAPLGSDDQIEALLDGQGGDQLYGERLLNQARETESSSPSKIVKSQPSRALAIAAVLVLLAIPVAILTIAKMAPDGNGGGETAGTFPTPDQPGSEGDGGSRLVEFQPDFPEPAFVGTPLDIRLPNLEAAHPPRLSFTAPEKVHVISQGAEVTSSESLPLVGDFAMITDGKKAGDDAHMVELPPGHHWVQIDLGEQNRIYAIALWHYHKQMRAYRDVVIEVSPEPSFSSGVTIVFNNDHDNSIGLGVGDDPAYIETNHGRIIDVSGVTARYMRLHSQGNTTDDLNHYTEVEVYGLAAADIGAGAEISR